MNVAFIPVRGGSRSIPLKNIRSMAGRPLVYWTAKAANDCSKIDRVYVATDSIKIKDTVERFGLPKVEVIGRKAETASDTASTESAMMEFAQNYEFDTVVLVQATSPLLTAEDLTGGYKLYEAENTDSVLSVVRQKRFLWNVDKNGLASSMNYDIYSRPRRQEFDGYLVENGAFYITGRNRLLESGSRISGKIRAYEMDESSYLEIDEPGDWDLIELQLKKRCHPTVEIPEIKLFLTDCDGCLTDGGMYYSENGDELKKFNTKDGLGFRLLKEHGILTGMITGEDRELNRRRSKKLGLDIYEAGVTEKLTVVEDLCKKYGICIENVAYVGDDLNDVPVIRMVGFGCTVADGREMVKEASDYVTKAGGGQGAVREVIDLVLKSVCNNKQNNS